MKYSTHCGLLLFVRWIGMCLAPTPTRLYVSEVIIWEKNMLTVLGTYLGKTAPENPPVSLNSLFPEDSVSTDSDEDLAEELDEFFRFMIWNDLSGEEEEEDSSFIEDEGREGSISADITVILMTLMMTDIYLKYPIIE